MKDAAVILSAVRTPIGSFMGTLSTVSAPQLGATAIRTALDRAQISPDQVNECVMGNVLTAGLGQAPARQAAIHSGLPKSVECMTINKVCGSGLKAVMLASQSISCGQSEVVVAGGQENMSLAPHLVEKSRNGFRMGHFEVMDSMVKDGLWDPYNSWHMGFCAEMCAKEFEFSRQDQDAFAMESYKKAQAAIGAGWFTQEIAPVTVSNGKETQTVSVDEEPGKAKFEKMSTLRPAFDKSGTITAANASKINDGASALVICSESKAKALGARPIVRIVSQASFAQDPKWFTTAPIGAIEKVLRLAGLKTSDIDLWEINEAFAVVTMAAIKKLSLPSDRVNVRGGAIALGHPIGASGARVLTTLIHSLLQSGAKRGLATLCIGGGEAAALIVERV